MTAFSRLVVLAVLYLSLLTSAIPVVQNATSTDLDTSDIAARAVRKAPVQTRPKAAKPRVPVKRPTAPVKKPTPVKRPVPAKPPVKKPPVKTPPKTSTPVKTPPKTTTPTTGQACPMPSKAPTKSKPRALFDALTGHYFVKRSPVFLGWHGTNSNTWNVWHRAGYLKKPWSWLDIIRQSNSGRSGADQELGEGVYLTDQRETAEAFANINSGRNSGTTPVICAIFALSERDWVTLPKVWLPDNLIGDSSDQRKHQQYEAYRLQWIQRVFPTIHPSGVIRFAPLDRGRGSPPSQFVIPSSLTNRVYAECAPVGHIPPGAPRGNINFTQWKHAWHIFDATCTTGSSSRGPR